MGEEIKKSRFTEEDFQEFVRRLKRETDLLKRCFEKGWVGFEGPMVGFELETWLVDSAWNPAPVNEAFLLELNDPAVVHELSRFNVEFNSVPNILGGKTFGKLRGQLEQFWRKSQRCAARVGAEMIMVGILPTLRQGMLSGANMSTSERYLALNEQIFIQRGGRPLELDIRGKDHLKMVHNNVMLESTATSLQIHVSLPLKRALRLYNAALIISSVMVALAANSPFLFEKQLWDETRIPVFEQAISLNEFLDRENYPVGRVTFGSGYLEHSFLEPFQENLDHFPPLLPYLFEDEPEMLRHLRLHNGTLWRWNRPVIGISKGGKPHLRLEHRATAAGPSIPDVVANIAFFVGLTHHLSQQEVEPESRISFSQARKNFYRAAQEGLNATIEWLDGDQIGIRDLILHELLPQAEHGLKKLEIIPSEIRFYLRDIIGLRLHSGQNGANWQKSFIEKHGPDFRAMTEAYVKAQRTGKPVHEWNL